MQGYTLKEMSQILIQHGWYTTRRKSSHIIFENIHIKQIITLPDHGKSTEICRPMARRLLKEIGLLHVICN